MAENTVKVGVDVSDNGTSAKTTKNVENLKDVLTQTEAAARRAGKAVGAMNAPGSATIASAKAASQTYGVSRGTIGTGAEGRDFAKQSQGLGGLVRLYATFAANIFAATAAFQALSKAADTANLIKGLDQLGAASGKNLGYVAKQLVIATDGAVSLREAFKATAQASSAGLSTANILKLGVVAKQASQALGVDMGDALSRLSRGITKLEPELLDELGIFTRIEKSSQDYARSIGKSALALTDFEKRQAFANAVLAEGEQKFSAISLIPNPYAKISANLQNLSDQTLGVVNNVLTPLLNLLANSPTALALGIGFIAKTLIAQALPALSQWRSSLADAAAQARKSAADISESFGAAYVEKLEAGLRIPDLKKQIVQYEADLKKLAQVPQGLQKSRAVSGALAAGAEATPAQLGALTREINARKTQVEALAQATDKASKTAVVGYTQEIAYLEKLKATTKALIADKAALNVASDKAVDIATTERVSLSESARTRIATQAAAKSARLDVLLPVADRTKELGFLDARRKLLEDTADSGIKGFNKLRTVTTGTFIAAATSAGMFAEAFLGPVMLGIAAVTAAYQVLDYFFAKNNKEIEVFNSAVESSHTSVETLNRTLEDVAKKNIGESLSVKSIAATAEALTGLSASLDTVVKSLEKANIKASGFDKFIDGFLTVIGKDLKSKFATEVAYSISEGFKALPEGAAKEEAKQKLSGILGGAAINFENIKTAIDDLPANKVVEFGSTLASAMQKATAATAETANKLTEVSTALDLASKTYDEFLQSQASGDAVSKLGATFVNAGIAMDEAFKNPVNSLITLRDLVKDTSRLRLLPEESQKQLLSAKSRIDELSVAVETANKKIIQLSPKATAGIATGSRKEQAAQALEKSEAGKEIQLAKAVKIAAEQEAKDLAKQFSQTGNTLLSRGLELIYKEVSLAGKEASLGVSRAIAAGMSGVGTADVTASLKREEISIQQQQIDLTQSLNYTMIESNVLAEEANALRQVELNQAERAQGKSLPQDYFDRATKDLARLSAIQAAKSEINVRGITKEQFEKMPAQVQKIVFPFLQASLTTQAKTTQLKGQAAAAGIEQKAGRAAEQEAVLKRNLQYALDSKNIEMQRVGLLTAGSTIINTQLLAKKQALEVEIETATNAIKIKDVDAEIAKTTVRYAQENDAERKEAYKQNIQDLGVQKLRTIELSNQNAEISAMRRQAEALKNTNELALANLAQQNSSLETVQAQESARLDIAKSELEYRVSLGLLNQTAAVEAEAALAREVAGLELKKQLSDAAYQNEVQLNAIRLTTATQLLGAKTPEDQSAVTEQGAAAEARVNALYGDRLTQIKAVNDAKLIGLDIDQKQKTLLAEIADLTASLTEIFGELGTKIGGVAGSYKTYMTASKKLDEQQEDSLKDKIKGTSAYEYQQKKNAKDRAKYDAESYASMAGSAKKMFKEKTVAYKALDAFEQVMHVAKLAMMAEEAIASGALTATKIGDAIASAGANALDAITAAYSAPWPIGFVAGAAMTAIMAGLLGAAFGGGSSSASVPTAAERQETQGRGTVLGDTTAQSNSVRNSLEIIAATSVEDLSFSNRMVQLLQSIDQGITGAAKGIYNLQGLRGGSAFGTLQGTSSSGINIPVLGGLFSSSTTKTITDAGLVIKGFFSDLVSGAQGVVQQYEEITKVRKKSGFFGIGGSTRTSVSYNYRNLPEENLEGLIDVFQNANSLILEIGGKLGMQEQSILNTLKQVDISTGLFSLKDLTGKDLEEALNALVNNVLDKAAGAVFSVFEQYQQMGEGMLETVIRVVDANDKINLALTSIGKSTIGVGIALSGFAGTLQMASFDISEALVDAAGGLQNFLEQAKSFRESFLTEAQQMAPIREAVGTEISRLLEDVITTTTRTERTGFLGLSTKTTISTTTEISELNKLMQRLGISVLDTKEEFALLVQNVDLTTESGRQLYQELMNVAPTFAKLEDYEKKLADSRLDQQERILDLLAGVGAESAKLALTRRRELEGLDDLLKPTQLYIYALEDEATIRDKLIKARDQEKAAIEKTISALKTSIQTLKDYKTTLLGGAISTLTPEQKYLESKQTLLDLTAVAQGPAGAERDAALAKLPAASDAFLNASRIINASGAQYTADFNTVLSIVNSTSSALTTQLSTAELQLSQLESQTSFLDVIAQSTSTVAELLPQYLAAVANTGVLATNAAAGTMPAVANGVTPVTTATPGSPTAVNEQLATTIVELRTEISGLRTEITTLRTEQQAQATQTVVANYDASNLNAQQIIENLQRFWRDAEFYNRNAVNIR